MGMSSKGAGALENVMLRTRPTNKFGTPFVGKQVKKGQKKIPLPPSTKYKANGYREKMYNPKTIKTPLPTPYSIKTGVRINKDSTTKKLERIREECVVNGGKTTIRSV